MKRCQESGHRSYTVGRGTVPVATDVLQTTLLGPSWLPSSRHLVYVKNLDADGYPIEVAGFDYQDTSQQIVRVPGPIRLDTQTHLNADVQSTRTGESQLLFQHLTRLGGLPIQFVHRYELRASLPVAEPSAIHPNHTTADFQGQTRETEPRDQYLPRWAPDSEKYAFLEVKNLAEYTLKIRAVSGETIADLGDTLQQIVHQREDKEEDEGPPSLVAGHYFFDWAPDSQRYIFSFLESDGLFCSANLAGKMVYRLTRSQQPDRTPRWSPNGEFIVFVRGKQLYLLQSETQFRNPQEKLAAKALPLFGFERAAAPNWSPDSRQIAFVGKTGGDSDIYLYNIKTGASRRITQTEGVSESHPVFSPDGKWLAFYSQLNSKPHVDIAIAHTDQSRLRQYQTHQSDYTISDGTIQIVEDVLRSHLLGPSWLAGNRNLVYVKNDEERDHPIEIAKFHFNETDLRVRVSEPTRLDTKTQLNADVQAARNGKPNLIFQCYAQADHLPVKRVQLYTPSSGEMATLTTHTAPIPKPPAIQLLRLTEGRYVTVTESQTLKQFAEKHRCDWRPIMKANNRLDGSQTTSEQQNLVETLRKKIESGDIKRWELNQMEYWLPYKIRVGDTISGLVTVFLGTNAKPAEIEHGIKKVEAVNEYLAIPDRVSIDETYIRLPIPEGLLRQYRSNSISIQGVLKSLYGPEDPLPPNTRIYLPSPDEIKKLDAEGYSILYYLKPGETLSGMSRLFLNTDSVKAITNLNGIQHTYQLRANHLYIFPIPKNF